MIEDDGSCKIPAVLLSDIEYNCLIKGIIFIPANTLIQVDIENDIALIGNTHVYIDTHEYRPLYS